MIVKIDRYGPDYKGPKAGISSHEEWTAVRDYQAYLWIIEKVWTYADFDCYLYAVAEMVANQRIKNIKNE